MKFFTLAWVEGELPEAETDQVWEVYSAHLASLGPSLPREAHRLSTEVSLHDALIRRVEHRGSDLDLLCRAGDNQRGYVGPTRIGSPSRDSEPLAATARDLRCWHRRVRGRRSAGLSENHRSRGFLRTTDVEPLPFASRRIPEWAPQPEPSSVSNHIVANS